MHCEDPWILNVKARLCEEKGLIYLSFLVQVLTGPVSTWVLWCVSSAQVSTEIWAHTSPGCAPLTLTTGREYSYFLLHSLLHMHIGKRSRGNSLWLKWNFSRWWSYEDIMKFDNDYKIQVVLVNRCKFIVNKIKFFHLIMWLSKDSMKFDAG